MRPPRRRGGGVTQGWHIRWLGLQLLCNDDLLLGRRRRKGGSLIAGTRILSRSGFCSHVGVDDDIDVVVIVVVVEGRGNVRNLLAAAADCPRQREEA